MCGIAGIVHAGLTATELASRLKRMQAALRHRGPDDEGTYLFDECEQQPSTPANVQCGLAHRRLSILDLSPAGHQPMGIRDCKAGSGDRNRYWITFNGEIYNFKELRKELERAGDVFRSSSDTEVILRLYQRHGPECVKRLRGMFAFALWDEWERTCLLARDPLGIKPLYLATVDNCLVFASELRALLASGLVGKELDREAVFGYFLSGSVPEPRTLIRDVRCLPAGTTLTWDNGAKATKRFWRIRFDADVASDREAVARTRTGLLDSIQKHHVSDVPVGLFLSGGIDSTAVLALSCAVGQKDIQTFSVSFDNPGFNEGDVAARSANHFGARHSDWRLGPEAGQELFRDYLERLDQPSIDGFNTFVVSKFAREHDMKVVLSGLGGDEVFGGYPSFRNVPRMMRLAHLLGPARNISGSMLGRSGCNSWRRLGGFLEGAPGLESAYNAYRGVFPIREAGFLADRVTGATPGSVDMGDQSDGTPTNIGDQISELELSRYMRNQLLRDSDVMSMTWGLELRVPLVDHVLLDVLTGIAPARRLQPGKKLLLDAVPEVPEWVSKRPKRGFAFPFADWFERDWRDIFRGQEIRGMVQIQTWYQKWSVFVLRNWCGRHGIRTDL